MKAKNGKKEELIAYKCKYIIMIKFKLIEGKKIIKNFAKIQPGDLRRRTEHCKKKGAAIL